MSKKKQNDSSESIGMIEASFENFLKTHKNEGEDFYCQNHPDNIQEVFMFGAAVAIGLYKTFSHFPQEKAIEAMEMIEAELEAYGEGYDAKRTPRIMN